MYGPYKKDRQEIIDEAAQEIEDIQNEDPQDNDEIEEVLENFQEELNQLGEYDD